MQRYLGATAAVLGLLGVSIGNAARGAEEPVATRATTWTPPFYAYCIDMGVKGKQPLPLAEQATLLHELGYDGIGHALWLDDQIDKSLADLDQAGVKLYMAYLTVNLKTPDKLYDPRAIGAIAKLQGRPTTISVVIVGLPAGDPRGMEPAVKALRELGDVAAAAGLRVAIYNHVNNWTESIPFALEVVKKANHPRVGVNFNLCHWLKVDGDKDYRPLLRAHAARIFVVTINGAQLGSQAWTNGLIQPLDRGDFDNRALLTALRDAGYRGPVGLMCYGVPDDARDQLSRSLKVWKSWQNDLRR